MSTPGTAAQATRPTGAPVLRIPPPLYYGGTFAVGMALHAVTVPLAIGARPETAVLGVVGLVAGTVLGLAGVREVVTHHTTIIPHHAVSNLVTTGAYRFSRNPMYAGLALAYAGGALVAGTWWPLITLPVALVAIRRVVIDPEERYLAGRFGEVYADYRARVRRWL